MLFLRSDGRRVRCTRVPGDPCITAPTGLRACPGLHLSRRQRAGLQIRLFARARVLFGAPWAHPGWALSPL